MFFWGRWSKITEMELHVLWHSAPLWNAVMLGLEMFLNSTFHVSWIPAIIKPTCNVFLSLAFVTHWYLLKFLSVALYKVSMLEVFSFSSDSLRIEAAGPMGRADWMPCVVLSFSHRYCFLLVASPAGDVLVFCLSSFCFWPVCTMGIILFSLVISWILAVQVIAQCRSSIGEPSPDGTSSLLFPDGPQYREEYPLGWSRWRATCKQSLILVVGLEKLPFFFLNSQSF